jgi:hypothetical protein
LTVTDENHDTAQHGPDNITVILQGRMVKPGEIVNAGISVMPKQKA